MCSVVVVCENRDMTAEILFLIVRGKKVREIAQLKDKTLTHIYFFCQYEFRH